MFARRSDYICRKNRLSISLRNFDSLVTVRPSDHPSAVHENQYDILHFLSELRRAKRASGAPWVIKSGKPSIRENLVMT